ncbi:MAG: hypothetical protein HZA08_05980 [Nitrospirae bacterium]|nr:hypothetical protein [Nitrospirota bacterium]
MILNPSVKRIFQVITLLFIFNLESVAFCNEPYLKPEESELSKTLQAITGQGNDLQILMKPDYDFSMSEDATLAMMHIQMNWNKWSPEFRESAGRYFLVKPSVVKGDLNNRPVDEDLSLRMSKTTNVLSRKYVRESHILPNWVETANFNIEWGNGLSASDSGTDSDKILNCSKKSSGEECNRIPDIVGKWVEYFEDAWTKETSLGFEKPAGTGNYLYDVYIANSQDNITPNNDDKTPTLSYNYLGYTSTYSNGENGLKTGISESNTYIVVNGAVTDKNIMKATSAHEFFHAIQFSYPNNDGWFLKENHWWIEATATWMEEVIHDDANIYYNRVQNWLRAPWLSLKYSGNRYTDHEYGDVLFVQFMTEVYLKDITFVKYVLEDPDSGIKAFNNVLSSYYKKGDFESAFKEFVALNALTASGIQEKGYEEGMQYGKVAIEKIHHIYPVLKSEIYGERAPQELGANYIQFMPSDVNDNNLMIEFNGTDNNWAAMVVKVRSDGSGFETEEMTINSFNRYGCFVVNGFGTIYSEVYFVPVVLLDSELFDSASYYYNASLNSVCNVTTNIHGNAFLIHSDTQTEATAEPKSDKRCFIATVAFGSSDSPYVMVLRNFRDKYLIPYNLGRKIVNTYYSISPAIADFLEQHPPAPFMVRITLFPVIGIVYLLLVTSLFVKIVLIVLIICLFLFLKYHNHPAFSRTNNPHFPLFP